MNDILYERSKNDREIIVGAEIRELVGEIRNLRAALAEKDREVASLRAERDALTQRHLNARELAAAVRIVLSSHSTMGQPACGCFLCTTLRRELTAFESVGPLALNYDRERAERAESERDAARAEVEMLREVLCEVEAAMTWALDKSPEAAANMVKESTPWRIKARALLAGKDGGK